MAGVKETDAVRMERHRRHMGIAERQKGAVKRWKFLSIPRWRWYALQANDRTKLWDDYAKAVRDAIWAGSYQSQSEWEFEQ
jgi:hypothetical protein